MTGNEWVTIWRFAVLCVLIAFACAFLGGCASAPQLPKIAPIEVRCGPSNYQKCAERCAKEEAGDAFILENARDVHCACRKAPEGS